MRHDMGGNIEDQSRPNVRPHRFFQVGRIFSILWAEPLGYSTTPKSFDGGSQLTPAECRVPAFINGMRISAIADSGAGANFVSLAFARRVNLKLEKHTDAHARLPNGTTCSVVGKISMPFRFENDAEVHILQFRVLARSLYDVVIGKQFLKQTRTLTKYFHERVKICYRKVTSSLRVNAMNARNCIGGLLNGQDVTAMPDTGSEVTMISADYARRRGFKVDRRSEHRKLLEFMDGSLARTCGVVKNLQWKYETAYSTPHELDMYVLEDLDCDVLLGLDFLLDTKCFEKYRHAWDDTNQDNVEQDDDCWEFYGIKEKILASKELDMRQQEARALREYEHVQQTVEDLPEEDQKQILEPLKQRYDELKQKNRALRRDLRALSNEYSVRRSAPSSSTTTNAQHSTVNS